MKDRGLLFMEKFRQLPWDDYGLDWCGDLSEVYGNFIEHEDKEVFIAYSVEADEVVYSFSIESDHIKYGSSKDFGDLTEVFDKILEFFEIEKKL